MNGITGRQEHASELRTVRVLVGLAITAAAIAALAGLMLIGTAPASGSTTEATLGLVAATSGLATAGFTVAAAIYAQVKDLWRHAPVWVRVAAWGVIVLSVLTSLWAS